MTTAGMQTKCVWARA